MTDDALFDTAEAARRLGVSAAWMQEHRAEVPYIRVGRRYRYSQHLLDRYAARHTVDPLAPSARSRRRPACPHPHSGAPHQTSQSGAPHRQTGA